MEDLKSFRVRVEDAWTVPLGDYQMDIPPPPAGGVMLAFILNLVKGTLGVNTFSKCFKSSQATAISTI
jgi:gamma-glutamyltranspeptidase